MNPVARLRDRVRRSLGIKVQRTLPPPGPVPPVGSVIVKAKVKMLVNVQIDDHLWRWLSEQGWREADLATDRRRYLYAPRNSLEMLMAHAGWQWDEIHDRIVAAAIYR